MGWRHGRPEPGRRLTFYLGSEFILGDVRIGELASRTGFADSQIRYYERRGLLPAPPRSDCGYRVYDEADVARLRLLRQAKLHGLALDEAGRLLLVAEQGCCDETEPAMRTAVQRRLAEIDAQIAELQALRASLAATLSSPPESSQEACGSPMCLPDATAEVTAGGAATPAAALPVVGGR